MINGDNNVDNEEENIDVSLNDVENPESSSFSIETQEEEIIECPICIEERDSMIALICGHTVCSECRILLIQHSQLDMCPICRFPLNWNGILRSYENNDNYQFTDHVVGEILNANILPPENNRIQVNNVNLNGRNVRIHRERNTEFIYNIGAAFVTVIFIILFWFMISGN